MASRRPDQRRRGGAGATRKVDPVRRVAFDVLRAVSERDAYANLTLPGLLRERGISGRDARFATELAYGALRAQGTYDAILGACLDRPFTEIDPPLQDLLRLGAHQRLAMRVPPHAAVSETVDLARVTIGPRPVKLVNAVLRRVGRTDLDGWAARLAPSADDNPIEYLAFRHAHPVWIVKAFADALDGSVDAVEACLIANNEAPSVTLVARPGRCDVAELVAAGAAPGRWSRYAAELPQGDPSRLPEVRDGRAGVQDEGSQLVALALADAILEGTDERWLDMCAGPGGKAALLAGLATSRGAQLLAVEQHEHRARLVSQALHGDSGDHEILVADASRPPWPGDDFDRVLLDAPCTGLGALRRRPESRWRRSPDDVDKLRPTQLALLRSALYSVRPGGLVAYVTCSPHLAETVSVVDEAVDERGDVEWVDARSYLPGVPNLGDGPDVQLWPHVHGTDAMYLALLRRAK